MRAWTRGEKIGFWSMIVGTVTCVAVLASLPSCQRILNGAAAARSEIAPGDPSRLLLEQQRKLFEEQSQAMKDELRRLHDERIALRQKRIEAIAQEFESDGKRSYDRILLESTCDVPIDVALYYLDLDQVWITRGWWTVTPGETVTTNAMTRNSPFYVYAENLSVGRRWDGEGKEDSLSLTVVDARFDHLDGEPFVYDSPRTVSFYGRPTGDTFGDQTEVIECYVEDPQPRPPPAGVLPEAPPPGQ